MALTLRVPALGESIREATLGAWKRAEGDEVAADEPLVEVESEKATLEVPSPGAGVLRKILRKSGETVAVGDVIAEIDQISAGAKAPAPASATATNGGSVRAAPSARKAMAESGLSPDDVKGSGRGGRISKQDVDRTLQARTDARLPRTEITEITPPPNREPEPELPPLPGRPLTDAARERVVPMSPLRRTVARRLVEAQHNAAILTTFNEIDMSNVLALRERYQERFVKAHGIKLGFMSFFVKAAVDALKAFPAVNGEVRGNDIIYKDHYDIGVAVGGC
jgi:2-oxoglutarate dehydrogenase E2 component (dihydrolipoamide succinyltransferase)